MPHHWIRVSTGTPGRLRDYVRDPTAFDRKLREIVAECNGEAVQVFFDADARAAYVLVDGNRGDFDVCCLDRELTDAKTFRVDLRTAEELPGEIQQEPAQQEPTQQEPSQPGESL